MESEWPSSSLPPVFLVLLDDFSRPPLQIWTVSGADQAGRADSTGQRTQAQLNTGSQAWIFILEGLATVIAGVISFWVIQDFPDTAKFLSEAERTVVVRRLQEDDQFSAGGESLRWKYIRSSFADWKAWVGMLMYSGSDMPLYAFALFLPTIINQSDCCKSAHRSRLYIRLSRNLSRRLLCRPIWPAWTFQFRFVVP